MTRSRLARVDALERRLGVSMPPGPAALWSDRELLEVWAGLRSGPITRPVALALEVMTDTQLEEELARVRPV